MTPIYSSSSREWPRVPFEIGKVKDLRADIFRDTMKRSVTTVMMADDQVFKEYSQEPNIQRNIC
jgi:hypothetical protein